MYFDFHTISAKNRLRLLGQLITISQIFRTKRLEDLFILYLQIVLLRSLQLLHCYFSFYPGDVPSAEGRIQGQPRCAGRAGPGGGGGSVHPHDHTGRRHHR
jgi:hypothetical protein